MFKIHFDSRVQDGCTFSNKCVVRANFLSVYSYNVRISQKINAVQDVWQSTLTICPTATLRAGIQATPSSGPDSFYYLENFGENIGVSIKFLSPLFPV